MNIIDNATGVIVYEDATKEKLRWAEEENLAHHDQGNDLPYKIVK